MLPLGLIAFAPVGEFAVEAGLAAALAAAIFGNLTAFFLNGALLPNEVPRASSVFLFAAFILRISGDAQIRASATGGVFEILFLAALCLALTGVIQVVFGALRLGNIARFVPYPVVAGLMTGLAISLVIYELPEVLGTHGGHGADGGDGAHHGINAWTVLVGLVTIVVFVMVRRRWPSLPSKLIGLAAGTAVAAVITVLIHADVGPRVPFLGKIPAPDALLPMFTAEGVTLALRFGYDLIITALAIAVVGSLDSLLAAVGESEGPLDTAHHPNRLLIALGAAISCRRCSAACRSPIRRTMRITTHHAGGRKLVSSLATTATLVLLLLYGAPLLQLIPVAALSAMMLVIAVGLIDRWAGSTIDRVRRGQYDSELIVNITLVILVAGVTIVFGLVAAVMTGLILSMGLFLAVMNRSLIRSVQTGTTRGSRRVYPPEHASLLRVEGHRIKLLELDGAIFFGTADRLGFEALRAAEGAQFLIIDLRRVTMIDASGALMLNKLNRLLREQGRDDAARAHLGDEQARPRAARARACSCSVITTNGSTMPTARSSTPSIACSTDARVAFDDREIAIGDFALLEGLRPTSSSS